MNFPNLQHERRKIHYVVDFLCLPGLRQSECASYQDRMNHLRAFVDSLRLDSRARHRRGVIPHSNGFPLIEIRYPEKVGDAAEVLQELVEEYKQCQSHGEDGSRSETEAEEKLGKEVFLRRKDGEEGLLKVDFKAILSKRGGDD